MGSDSVIHPAGNPLCQHPSCPPRVTAASNRSGSCFHSHIILVTALLCHKLQLAVLLLSFGGPRASHASPAPILLGNHCGNTQVVHQRSLLHQTAVVCACTVTCFVVIWWSKSLSRITCTNFAGKPLWQHPICPPRITAASNSSCLCLHSHMKAVLLDGCVTSCSWQCFCCHLGSGSCIHPAGRPLWQHTLCPPKVTATSNMRGLYLSLFMKAL